MVRQGGPYQVDLTLYEALGLLAPLPGPLVQPRPLPANSSHPTGIFKAGIDTGPISEAEYLVLDAAMPTALWRTFYRLLWHTGFRVSEALALERADFVLEGVVVHRLKRGRDVSERIPLPAWLILDCLELTTRQRLRPFRRTASGARDALLRACQAAGITRRLHPHNYRHAFGTRFAALELGLTALAHRALLAKMLGHGSLSSVDRYFEPGETTTGEAWAKLQGESERPEV